jgi:hypothetical protein
MGSILARLMLKPPGRQKAIPEDLKREAKIAERVLGDLDSVNALGEQVPFNCPGCGGVLWKMDRVVCPLPLPYRPCVFLGLAAQTQKLKKPCGLPCGCSKSGGTC